MHNAISIVPRIIIMRLSSIWKHIHVPNSPNQPMVAQMDKINIRAKLHNVMGHIRRNEFIDAFELVQKMSIQMDIEYYGMPENCIHMSRAMDGTCFNCGQRNKHKETEK